MQNKPLNTGHGNGTGLTRGDAWDPGGGAPPRSGGLTRGDPPLRDRSGGSVEAADGGRMAE